VRVGDPVEQTIAAAKETGADLVVIGRQRYHVLPFGAQGIMQISPATWMYPPW